MTNTKTQAQRVLEVLKTGEKLTAKQIAYRFNIASPHKILSNLRFEGYAVHFAEHTDTKGHTNQKKLEGCDETIFGSLGKSLTFGVNCLVCPTPN